MTKQLRVLHEIKVAKTKGLTAKVAKTKDLDSLEASDVPESGSRLQPEGEDALKSSNKKTGREFPLSRLVRLRAFV
jgi:hypothetical protein